MRAGPRDLIEYVERLSDEMYIPRIGRDDGLVIYTLVYMLSSSRGERLVAVDAGAGIGYSTLWIVASLEDTCTGGRVYAVEKSPERYRVLERNMSAVETECTEIVPVNRDAVEFLVREPGLAPDFVFIDIDKSLYDTILEVAIEKMRRGGVIAFHNAYMVRDFVERVSRRFREKTRVSVIPTDEGVLVIRL